MAALDLPRESAEYPFLRYWAENLVDPTDPQNRRWLAIEIGQPERSRKFAQELAHYIPLPGARTLDVGCQSGALVISLSEHGAVAAGIDVTDTTLAAARIRAGCHGVAPIFERGEAEQIPFGDDAFDLITCIDVLEHVRDHDAALAELVRVLRPRGVLFLQAPNRTSPRWIVRDPHYRMAGISVLPPRLGRAYVVGIRRRRTYDVGTFPVGAVIARKLTRLGLRLIDVFPGGRLSRWHGIPRPITLSIAPSFVIVAAKPERSPSSDYAPRASR